MREVQQRQIQGETHCIYNQVLQQIQQNPDPRIIENLAEALHKSKIESLEQEVQAKYSSETRRVEELYHQEAVRSVAVQEQAIAQSAVHVFRIRSKIAKWLYKDSVKS